MAPPYGLSGTVPARTQPHNLGLHIDRVVFKRPLTGLRRPASPGIAPEAHTQRTDFRHESPTHQLFAIDPNNRWNGLSVQGILSPSTQDFLASRPDFKRDKPYTPLAYRTGKYFGDKGVWNAVLESLSVYAFGSPLEKAALGLRGLPRDFSGTPQAAQALDNVRALSGTSRLAIPELLRVYSDCNTEPTNRKIIDTLFAIDPSGHSFADPLFEIMMQKDLHFYSAREDKLTQSTLQRFFTIGYPVMERLVDVIVHDSTTNIRQKAISLIRLLFETENPQLEDADWHNINYDDVVTAILARWEASTQQLVVTRERPWRDNGESGYTYTIAKAPHGTLDKLTGQGDYNQVGALMTEISSVRTLLSKMGILVPDLLPSLQDVVQAPHQTDDVLAAK